MLAWVHQAIAGASEFLEGLFGIGGSVNANANTRDGAEGVEVGGRMVGSVRRRGGSEEERWVRELLDVAVEKMCLPLKVRLCWRSERDRLE
jgi:conserved oligomeric Golgi complex subunit 6